MKEAIVGRFSRTDPFVVLVALILGSIAYVAVKRYAPSGGEEIAGWVAAALALFARPDKKSGADATEHVDGTGALTPPGGMGLTTTVARASEALSVKREILIAWAKVGRTIDDLAELQAETAALEVVDRSVRSVPVEIPETTEP